MGCERFIFTPTTKTNKLRYVYTIGLSLKPPSQPPSNLEGGGKAPLQFGEGLGRG